MYSSPNCGASNYRFYHGHAVHLDADGHRPGGQPVEVIHRPVDRVDDPAHAAEAGLGAALLAEEGVLRPGARDRRPDRLLRGGVHLGHHVGRAGLRLGHAEIRRPSLDQQLARLGRGAARHRQQLSRVHWHGLRLLRHPQLAFCSLCVFRPCRLQSRPPGQSRPHRAGLPAPRGFGQHPAAQTSGIGPSALRPRPLDRLAALRRRRPARSAGRARGRRSRGRCRASRRGPSAVPASRPPRKPACPGRK